MKSAHFIALCVADISSDLAICILVFHFRTKFIDLMPSGFVLFVFRILFIYLEERDRE